MAPLLVWGAGGGIAGAPVIAVAMNVTAPARAGMVAGTVSTLASIGAGLGTATLGLVYQAASGPDPDRPAIASATSAVLACSAAIAVLAALAVLGLITRRAMTTDSPAASPPPPPTSQSPESR